MQLLRIIQICEKAFLIIVIVMQIPFTAFTFVNKNYTLSAADNITITNIETQAKRQYIQSFDPWSVSCTGSSITINSIAYCEVRYHTNYSKIVKQRSSCAEIVQDEFSTPERYFCFKTKYTTEVCNDSNLPCYKYNQQKFPLQAIKSTSVFELNRFIGTSNLSLECDNLQRISQLMIAPVSGYYESLNKGLLISWFVNLAIVFILLTTLALKYLCELHGAQQIVEKILLSTTILSMLILSVMGLILSISRFQIGLITDNIHSYAGCFDIGPEKSYLSGFPYMYGMLMDTFAMFLLVIALILFVLAIFCMIMQLFKKSYIEGSQNSSQDGHYTELNELHSKKDKVHISNFECVGEC